MQQHPIIIISGPTASGKSDLATTLAIEIDAEIISCDSRQIYRGMEIGTAAPTAEEMQGIPHHFVGIFEPDRSYSAGEYGNDARKKIKEIRSRGKNILVCGGSGMYLQAVFGMIYEGRQVDPALRRRVQQEGEEIGWAERYRALSALDPEYCRKISPNDVKRISRGWEIYYSSGNIPSMTWKEQNLDYDPPRRHIGLDPERQYLIRRIEQRTDRMMKAGLAEECRELMKKYPAGLNAFDSLGYKEIFSAMRNEISMDEAVDLIKIHTRQFARRQSKWFRRYPPHRTLSYTSEWEYEDLLSRLMTLMI